MTPDLILCLDSGTTGVKTAVFDRSGMAVARAEVPNSALERAGKRVEQDMEKSISDVVKAAGECMAQVSEGISAIAVTGQGDGLWPLGADLAPAGKAMTWLDGRAASMIGSMSPELDRVEALTSSRPTAASQTLQLLWLQRHDPDRFATIEHALRLKEWLFFQLTGELRAEAGSALPAWGDWRTGAPCPEVPAALGLDKGIELLPPIGPVADCIAPLTREAADLVGLPAGLPVVIGPGDVQSSFVGLGVGPGLALDRASVFGTSAIHGRYYGSLNQIPEKRSGAMVQRFASGQGYVCFHPSFNGGTVTAHVADVVGGEMNGAHRPAYSGVVLHPFFEPGGERAPITDPRASAAMFGLRGDTTPKQLGWAGREALAFVTRMSHSDLGKEGQSGVAVGGGVARDPLFPQLLASVLGRPVQPHTGGDTALRGLAAITVGALEGKQLERAFLERPNEVIAPELGAVRAYLERKYRVFRHLLTDVSSHWEELAKIEEEAKGLM